MFNFPAESVEQTGNAKKEDGALRGFKEVKIATTNDQES
jgi:hypothetical protein